MYKLLALTLTVWGKSMLCSMTAFAKVALQTKWGELVWEIRSVNQRFLDVSMRLPESVRELEAEFRELIRQSVKRGKLECQLRLQFSAQQAVLKLDDAIATQLIHAAETLHSNVKHAAPIQVTDLLRWPELVSMSTTDCTQIYPDLRASFVDALNKLVAARQREGEAIQALILQRLVSIKDYVAKIEPIVPKIISGQQDKLKARLSNFIVDINQDRLEQELVFYAQRSDVAEELDRLKVHVGEVMHVLEQGGAVGRRLDFLLQELNREANTLASKSLAVDTTYTAVELKVLIEQIREQIQNLE